MAKKGFIFDRMLHEATTQQEELEEKQKQTDAYVKKHLTILEDFKFLIPPLTADELHKLETSIIAEGCRDPLMVWDKGEEWILIDGHNRYQICSTHNIDYNILQIEFEDAESAANWIVNNQLGKRNVTSESKSYLRGIQYSREKRREANWQNLRQYANVEKKEIDVSGVTSERLGALHKVSEKTIKRDEKYAISVDKICGKNRILKAQILQKQIILSKGKLESLCDEPSEKLEQLGECLMQGSTFSQAYANVYPKPKEDFNHELHKKEIHINSIKKNIVKALDTVVKTGDKTHIEQLRAYLLELEQNLS